MLLSGTPALCQFDVLNPVSTLIPSCLISDSFLKQNGVLKSVEDRQTLQTASATERPIDAAAIKLLNPRIQNSSATKIQKFSIKQLTQSEYPKILQALQRSTNSPSNYVTPSIQNSFSCSKIHGFSTKDMSVHERATKSDERTTTNGEDILRSEESADENWGGRRFHTGVMLFADKIRGKGRRGYFLQLRFRSAGTPACARHRLRTPFASRRARVVRLLSLTLILKNQYRSSSCPR